MPEKIRFARNYNDQSTDEGFQFEVICNRCGTGYRTPFKPTAIGRVSNVLETASGLLGGILGRAADVSDRVQSATWEKAHDKAFAEAMKELEPDFIQCPRCSTWVCREACWSTKKGLCKECAPDLGVEMAAAQASKSVEEVWAHAKMSAEDKKLTESDWREGVRASCPNCEKPLAANAKFCPECGHSLKTATHCTECGAKLTEGAKFCADCGTKAG